MAIETIFWTQIASIIGFFGTLFVLYHLLVKQKEATIQTQKENIVYLKHKLDDAKLQSTDYLNERLDKRVKSLESEMSRLENDKTSTEEQITAKELELHRARTESENLTKQVLSAREVLSNFQCPDCGASLVEMTSHSESVEYNCREIDIDHEYTAFECGYALHNGEVRRECKNSKQTKT